MGPVGRTSLTDHFPYPFPIDLQYIALLPLCSSPRYQRNIPYTKIRGFGMQISYSHTIWYLQFQLVCAKLLLSMGTFFIDKSSKYVFLVLTGRSF